MRTWMPDYAWPRPAASSKEKRAGRKNNKSKIRQLEPIVHKKLNYLTQLQNEQVLLKQKASVLELLLEVASEIAIHKRQHTGVKFPELCDKQLADFLEGFLQSYGGYAAERPTARNGSHLDKLNVKLFQDMDPQNFSQQYNALVQKLSLLLQATDNSMMGGLATCIHSLRQLLLGALLWSPFILLQASSHHLVAGQPIQADAEHSAACITNIELSKEQEDSLVILGDLYNSQVAAMADSHNHLVQHLNQELPKDNGSTATTILQISTNMNMLLSCHQLFHATIMSHLSDQQLALLCVRCFPRFPSFQDLLTALMHIRIQSRCDLGHKVALPKGSQATGLDGPGRTKDRPSGAGSNLSSLPDLGAQVAAAAEQVPGVLSAQRAGAVTAAMHCVGKDEADSSPQQLDSLAAAAVAVLGGSDMCVKSTAPGFTGGRDSSSITGTEKQKGPPADQGARFPVDGSSSQKDDCKDAADKAVRHKHQRAAGHEASDGGQGDLAEGLAAGVPLDPVVSAAQHVDLSPLAAKGTQQGTSTSSQRHSAPGSLMQQLKSVLSTPNAHVKLLQLLTSQPDLALQLQEQSGLLEVVQAGVTAEQLQQQLLLLSSCNPSASASICQQQQGHNWLELAQHSEPPAKGTDASGMSWGITTPVLDEPVPGATHHEAAGWSPVQNLLYAVASLWENCRSVAEAAAATAASSHGQSAVVTDAVSAAEAAVQTTLRSLQETKEKLNRLQCGQTAAAGMSGPADVPFPRPSLPNVVAFPKSQPHISAPYSNTSHLQAPHWPAHGLHLVDVQHNHWQQSDSVLRSQLGFTQGLTTQGQSPGSQGWPTAQHHLVGQATSNGDMAALHEQDQSASGALLQQQPGRPTATAAQLLQTLQMLQEQDRSANAAALLKNSISAAVPPGHAGTDSITHLASLLQQLQNQAGKPAANTTHNLGISVASALPAPEGAQRGVLRGPQLHPSQAHPTFHAAVDNVASFHLGQSIPTSSTDLPQPAQPSICPAAVAASAAPSAPAAGRPPGAGIKEDSPSAGSCITSTGQQQQQVGVNGVLPSQGLLDAHHQLDGVCQAAVAAAGASSRLQHGTAGVDAFALLVTKLLKGQASSDGRLSGATATATALQALLSAQHLPQGQALAALLAKVTDLTMSTSDTPAAAAASMIPPAAAAAIVAKQAAAVGGTGAGSMHKADLDGCEDQMDVDASAVSALELLASAAASTGCRDKPPGDNRLC